MADNSDINRFFFVRFFAITLVLVLLNQYKVLPTEALAELVVSPLGTGVNASEPCVVYSDEGRETITIHGSPSGSCKHQVSSSNPNSRGFEIQILNSSSENYFYVRKLGVGSIAEHCGLYDDFAVIDGQGSPCGIVLFHTNFQFNLHGNVSIIIREVLSQDSNATINCSESGIIRYPIPGSPSLSICSSIWYPDLIDCDTGISTCTLDLPKHCYASLGYREMNLSCSLETVVHYRAVIVYPNSMYVLDAVENNIIAIGRDAFQNMYEMQTLLLQFNKLRALKRGVFSDLHNLLTLNVQGNLLASLQPGCFQGLDMLTELDLRENMLKLLPVDLFRNLTNLNDLILDYNMLSSLNSTVFHGLNKLKKIKLQGNILTTLDVELFRGLSNLRKVDLDENQLVRLEVGIFQGLYGLVGIGLQRNNLSILDGGLFQDLTNLEEIDLDDNLITHMDLGLFHGMTKLKELDIDYNRLTRVDVGLFQGLISLTELDLDYNHLKILKVGLFDDLNELLYLDLDSNLLATLDVGLFRGLRKLDKLWLAQNKLVTLDVNLFHGLDSLTELYLHYNQLVTLEVGLLSNLKHLVQLALSDNRLITISEGLFQGLHNLSALRLDGNRISGLHSGVFKNMFNLKKLYLDNNHLSYLKADLFKDLINLDTLTLHSNRLKYVDFDLLQSAVNLAILDFGENQLQSLPNITHLKHLFILILNGNELLQIGNRAFSGLNSGVKLLVSQHEICECYVPQNITCSASFDRSPYLTCDRLLSDSVLVIMMWLIGISALCGNTFVLFWRNKRSRKNKVQSILLRNLALSDLQMGIYMMIIASADIHFGEGFPMAAETWRKSITCKIAGTLSIVSSEASVFFVSIISVDRLISTKYSHSRYRFGTKSTIIAVMGTWAFAAVLSIVPSILAGKYTDFYDNSHVCVGLPLTLAETFSSNTTTQEVESIKYHTQTIDITVAVSNGQKPGMYFSSAIFLGINSICYFVIVCCYVVIIQTVRKSSKRAGLTREMKNQLKLTVKVSVIVATDFLCWSPIILLGILVQCQVLALPPSVFAWSVTFVLPINSAINPFLYTIADVISIRRKRNDEVSRLTQEDTSRTPLERNAERRQLGTNDAVQDREAVTLPNVVI